MTNRAWSFAGPHDRDVIRPEYTMQIVLSHLSSHSFLSLLFVDNKSLSHYTSNAHPEVNQIFEKSQLTRQKMDASSTTSHQ
jgi:hypothetical protein